MGEPQLAVKSLRRLGEVAPGHEALRTELPEASMLAARQVHQQGGVRMRVVAPGADGETAGEGVSGGAGSDDDVDPVDLQPMDGVDMTSRTFAPNAGG
jgi:hypothetical protein